MPKTHDVNGNSFVANRRGRRLCDAFTGACVFNPQNAACPNDGTWCINAADVWTQVMELTHVRGRISQRVVPGASRLEKARESRRDVGNLESLLTACVHWQPLVNV